MTTPIYLVKLEDVEKVWFTVKDLIDKALIHSDGRMMSYDALQMILNKEMQLWVGVKDKAIFSTFLTTIRHHPRHTTLQIVTYATVTGHDADFDTCVDTFTRYGRDHGCIALEAWCRKGLVRKLPDWEHLYSVISKPIEPEQPVKRKRRRRSKNTNNKGVNT